ncbi:integral membrane protein GPR155 isoform X5 [Hippopotamus amphibius kiboko]|uniref:integral membrane protein GPR155 isoform X5 n=1 Tax=Hippopotamus amphibius kiboko TaxID=575201 RepID=UPI002596F5C7|nr:integral membrane protein GPR155 isoform X5 [Hippopotamus amphibius kiboko]
MKQGFNLEEMEKNNAHSIQAIRGPRLASSILFQSSSLTNGVIEEKDISEELPKQKEQKQEGEDREGVNTDQESVDEEGDEKSSDTSPAEEACEALPEESQAGLLAISLFLLKKRERVQIPVGIIIISGWGIPALLVGVLLITGKHNGESIDSAFFYGKEQMIITAVTLFCSIVIAGVSLMCMNRTSQAGRYEGFDQSQDHKAAGPGNTAFEDSPAPINEPEPFTSSIPETSCCSCSMGNGELHCPSTEPVANISTSGSMTPSFEKDEHCVSRCNSQSCILAQEEEQYLQSGDQQLTRHVLLCLLLIIGLFANLSSCLWWLFNQEPGRLYVELQFFCAVFNFGQGFISFGIFGLDKHLIILPFRRRLEFLWNNKETAENRDSSVPEEIKMTCQQFIHYHRDLCIQNIVKKRRCGAKTSAGTFCGCDLVNWLIEVGLASDRGEAVIYGDRLVQGGVIQHITNDYEFRDEYLFYRFLQKSPEQSPPAINANIPQQERYEEIEHSSPSPKT